MQVYDSLEAVGTMEKRIQNVGTTERLEGITTCGSVRISKAKGIDDKTKFAWWIPYTLRKCNVIILSTRYCIIRKTHKEGIEITLNVEQAYKIYEKNQNRFWRNSLEKEMHNTRTAFEILENDTPHPLVSCKKFTSHLILYVNMDSSRK